MAITTTQKTLRLTDNEIRDIRNYLEEGRPLPDFYRFLLFEDKKEVELVWNGKTNEVCNVVLPFQTIEHIDEPRSEKEVKFQLQLFDLDNRGRQLKGWTNKLIWGDNKLILSSLKNGPLRKEIEEQGGIKLIYIDPPFDVGANFSIDIEIGDETLIKQPNILEQIAYSDTWGKGADSFITMIYERLSLMKDLLASDGSIYIHCDWRVNSYIRLILDEVFGRDNLRNHIIWLYSGGGIPQAEMPKKHDDIFWYTKSNQNWIYNPQYRPYSEGTIQRGRTAVKGENAKLREEGTPINNWWPDIKKITSPTDPEKLGYPTQKSEELLTRIIKMSSNDNDLIADFFCGSGTTMSAAEKLGRKWIGTDLGKFAIHTSRKRLIELQRQLKKENQNYRAFEILNLGKYERQFYIGVNDNLRDEEKRKQLDKKEKDFINLILYAYKAEKTTGFKTFHGKKHSRLVSIGPVNLPVTRTFVEEVIKECIEKQITKVDIIAFEFEMGLFPNIQEYAKTKGIDLALKYIPPDVFDKRAVEKGQVVFHDVSYIEVKPHIKKGSIAVELTDFSVFYNQDSIAKAENELKNGGSKIVVENGKIIKISKDKKGIVSRDTLTKKWTDWIDYWAVDFDFESKKEIIKVKKEDESIEEIWSGDYIFENEWQSFRTKKDRGLELKSISHECEKGRRKIAVKVVDIFGNDTMKIIEVNIP